LAGLEPAQLKVHLLTQQADQIQHFQQLQALAADLVHPQIHQQIIPAEQAEVVAAHHSMEQVYIQVRLEPQIKDIRVATQHRHLVHMEAVEAAALAGLAEMAHQLLVEVAGLACHPQLLVRRLLVLAVAAVEPLTTPTSAQRQPAVAPPSTKATVRQGA
jgi:hypothetical protein